MASSIIFIAYTLLAIITSSNAELPAYTGPYGVGTIDLELPVQEPRVLFPDIILKNTNQTSRPGQSAFKLDTVLFTLYYPSDPGVKSSAPGHQWLPEPRGLIAQGLSGLSGTDPGLIQLGFNLYARNLTLPAQVDIAIANGTEKYPVMLFSHGQPTVADWYSQYFGEMASRGVVIVSATHRDGSSPATTVRFKNGTEYNTTLFTEGNVTPSISSNEFFAYQLSFRLAEWNEISRYLTQINSGDGASVAASSSRAEGSKTLSGFGNRLDLNKTIIAGHSFGANTVLAYLSSTSKTIPASAGLAFDPGQSSGPLPNSSLAAVPLLIAQSQEWSQFPPKPFYSSPSHFSAVKSIATNSLARARASWFMTLAGTVHPSVTDVGLIAPSFAQFFTNNTALLTLPPTKVLEQYVGVSNSFVDFLKGKGINGVLAGEVKYPEWKNVTNATDLGSSPWEVHVGTGAQADGKTSTASSWVIDIAWLKTLIVSIGGMLISGIVL